MGGFALGPFVFSADRAPVLLALLILLIASGIIARKRGPAISSWASAAALMAALSARLGFVIQHLESFRADPLSILAFWQGGFSPLSGAAGFAAVSAWYLGRRTDLILPAVASVVFAFIGWNVAQQLARGMDVAPLGDMQLATLSGDPVTPADWQGRPMVINLWASWCPPCRREMPMMAEVAAGLTDVDMYFVNQGEGAETVRRYLAREGIVIAPVMDPDSQMMRHFAAMGLPATLFIDASGTLRAAHMGEISHAHLIAGIRDLKESD